MRPFVALALLLALAAPLAAQAPRQGLLRQCLGNEAGVDRYWQGLGAEEKISFEALYAAYAANVRKRNEEKWSHGWLGNFWTHYVNDTNANGSLRGLFVTADTWGESRTKLEDQDLPQATQAYGRANADLAKDPGNQRLRHVAEAARTRLENLQELSSREFGTCSDWAADTKDVLKKVLQSHFTVDTEVHTAVKMFGDSGSHIYAMVCRKAGGGCVIFDPWKRGRPELSTPEEQAKGVSNAESCFKRDKPVE